MIYLTISCERRPWTLQLNIICVKTYIYETKSFTIVHTRFRRKLNFNTFPNRSQIFKFIKNFNAQGTRKDCRATSSLPSWPSITQEKGARFINNCCRAMTMTKNTNTLYICMQNTTAQWRRATQFLEKYTSHFIWKVACERELETEQNCNILTLTLLAITAFLSHSPGLLNGGLGAHSAGCWLSQLTLVTNGSGLQTTDFLSSLSYIIVQHPLLLVGVTIALIQPVHGQGYILIFLDRMHLLFT